MAFSARTGQIFDSFGTVVCDIHNLRVLDPLGRGYPPCEFVPSHQFAISYHPDPEAYVVEAEGRTFRIQITDCGLNNGVPYAVGVVVG